MCDEFQQYLYPILNYDFQQALAQEDKMFDIQYKNCFEYLDQVDINQDLLHSIGDFVHQDFQGSHPLDRNKIISFIAIGKLYTLEVMNKVFLHFAKHHRHAFYNITFKGEKTISPDSAAFLVYKYCCDKVTSI